MLRARGWPVPGFLVPEIILSLRPREWVAPLPAGRARALGLVAHWIVKVVPGRHSRLEPVAPVVVQEVLDLVDPVLVGLAAPLADVPAQADARERAVVGVGLAAEQQEPLVAVAEKISHANPSAPSVKSLKCGRLRA